jgi:site-specific recombinase XerD
MRRLIRPTAINLVVTKRIGWHTFRHSYSTLLKANGADIKVMQELLRHASTRVTLDTYTQAVTPAKRAAQTAVVTQFFPNAMDRLGTAAEIREVNCYENLCLFVPMSF